MAAVFYYIALPFIYLLSLLPFRVLYGLSDVVFVMLYHILGYRKKVVLTNLRNAFPEKSEAEIRALCVAFYRYLCDLFLEVFKTLTAPSETMLKHCCFTPEAQLVFDELADKNQSVVLVLGHLGNWEWAGNTFSLQCRQQLYVIYHPIANPYFDALMYRMRTRFGTKLIAMKETYRAMLAQKQELTTTAFIADQTPSAIHSAYWTTFLNQDTPVFPGTEIIAKKLNFPVVYTRVKRLKRGYYEINAEVLVANSAETREGEISELHTRRLERDILEQPETWLWTHRRWKHKRPENN
ncbi:MAG: lysophospholipid acyltransferase family protein [Saprospiraceae bacterium]|nr:lysophospholipid acyltransferase family protein [Saprospiraceae bacterium]